MKYNHSVGESSIETTPVRIAGKTLMASNTLTDAQKTAESGHVCARLEAGPLDALVLIKQGCEPLPKLDACTIRALYFNRPHDIGLDIRDVRLLKRSARNLALYRLYNSDKALGWVAQMRGLSVVDAYKLLLVDSKTDLLTASDKQAIMKAFA